jgi:hypothetical protein
VRDLELLAEKKSYSGPYDIAGKDMDTSKKCVTSYREGYLKIYDLSNN